MSRSKAAAELASESNANGSAAKLWVAFNPIAQGRVERKRLGSKNLGGVLSQLSMLSSQTERVRTPRQSTRLLMALTPAAEVGIIATLT